MNKSVVLVAVSALLVVACADHKSSDQTPAEQDRYSLSSISTAPAIEEIQVAERRETYAVADGAVSPMVEPLAAPMKLAMPVAPAAESYYYRGQDRENYQLRADNPVKLASEEPVSTFSVDVDTAGYSNVRRMLAREGRLPPQDAVKAEEMINYFSYHYPQPSRVDTPFSISTELAPSPWNPHRHLLQVGLKGFAPAGEKRPAANLVFLVDVSGSMQSPDKLPLVKKSLRMLVSKMDSNDRIALVVYAGAAGMVLDATSGADKAKILAAIDSLEAGGSTNGGAGIQLAYQLALQHFIEGGINRVLIASDGDMNVGVVNLEALKDLVEAKRQSGIALTTLGFGTGNYNDALMEQLADIGNGNAAYIDGLQEANKVLVEELQVTLLTIAKDVKIQVEFNPAVVTEHRLIGYQNRLLNREDFTNDKVDAGEIGAGHTVTALYELSLVGSSGQMIPGRRYAPAVAKSAPLQDEIAFVKLRYKRPEEDHSIEVARAITRAQLQPQLADASDDLRFAAAVAGFAQLLRGGIYTGEWHYDQLLTLARGARGADEHGYRGEFIGLVELARSLAEQQVSVSSP